MSCITGTFFLEQLAISNHLFNCRTECRVPDTYTHCLYALDKRFLMRKNIVLFQNFSYRFSDFIFFVLDKLIEPEIAVFLIRYKLKLKWLKFLSVPQLSLKNCNHPLANFPLQSDM